MGEAEQVARDYWGGALVRKERGASLRAYAPGARCRLPGEATPRDAAGMAAWFAELYDAVPDLVFELLDLAAQDDRVAARWRAHGTFTGPGRLTGLVPDGRSLDITGVDYAWVADGLVQRVEAYFDTGTTARQLGVLPPVGSRLERSSIVAANTLTRLRTLLRRG